MPAETFVAAIGAGAARRCVPCRPRWGVELGRVGCVQHGCATMRVPIAHTGHRRDVVFNWSAIRLATSGIRLGAELLPPAKDIGAAAFGPYLDAGGSVHPRVVATRCARR
jgi:hypothetical protein